MLQIKFTSVFVEDQAKALAFYTDILGFKKHSDFPMGEFRWLTVIPASGDDQFELALEPNINTHARTYQQGLYSEGIPITAFVVDDLAAEYKRLHALGVRFVMEPDKASGAYMAVFDDTCGNYIQLVQQ